MYKILTIDGGGIRGIIPAVILNYLEESLQKRTGDKNVTIADYFDMIAGTSTGGILTCFYLLPPAAGQALHSRYPAKDAVDLYTKRGKEIFKRKFSLWGLLSEIYPATGLEKILKETMGEITLSEARKDCLVTAYDITERKAIFFTRPAAQQSPYRNYLMRDIARATSAAPTYFEPAAVHSLGGAISYLVDGAMFAGNPALCAWVESYKMGNMSTNRNAVDLDKVNYTNLHESHNSIMVLSIGTGKERKKYDYDKAKDWGLLGWARPVVDILLSSSAEVVDYQMQKIFSAAGCPENYIRLEPALGKAQPDMDDASDKNIEKLTEASHAFIQENIERLEEIVEQLIMNK
jgi:patatin-like phospholipase/acyl hydrolase